MKGGGGGWGAKVGEERGVLWGEGKGRREQGGRGMMVEAGEGRREAERQDGRSMGKVDAGGTRKGRRGGGLGMGVWAG